MHPQLGCVVVTKAMLPNNVIRKEINAYVSLLKRLGNGRLAVIR
ncbi:hypothetical protein [Nitrosomonas sp. Nm84]|nr:hypothetical protein [Nitrosomonas sp. Nm84]